MDASVGTKNGNQHDSDIRKLSDSRSRFSWSLKDGGFSEVSPRADVFEIWKSSLLTRAVVLMNVTVGVF